MHVKQALGINSHILIEEHSEYLPSDSSSDNTIQSIKVEQPCAIHIFSNILDIESVSLKGVSKLITSSGDRHIVLCIGPANLNESRINAFKNYFKDKDIQVFADFRETNFGKHPNGRDYGCLIKGFTFSLKSAESVYAREGFVTYDASVNMEVPYSLKDDTDVNKHLEAEISSFDLVRKYMRVVDADIVNNDSQKDNVKHLQGAVRLIRRAAPKNPVLNLLNIFCILFLGQQENEMLEEEICNDYEEVLAYYSNNGNLKLLDEYADLLVAHAAIDESKKDYLQKLHTYIQLRKHLNSLNNIISKYTRR